jgi:hypothetical protein
MWRTRREMLGTIASLLIMMITLGGCLLIIAFSWPEKERRRPVMAARDLPVAVGTPMRVDAEIVPIVARTGSISKVREGH